MQDGGVGGTLFRVNAMGRKRPARKILLVDGHSLLYRSFHAIPMEMTSPTGEPTNAVFGFLNMLLKLLRERSPTHLVVTFDAGGSEARTAMFEEYKGHRPPIPSLLKRQIPLLLDVLDAMRVKVLEVEGVEADDLIASLTRRAEEDGMEVEIVTSDKDLLQLVGRGVKVVDGRADVVYDEKAVEEKFGVPPRRLGDFLALVGDASDNIPGVGGIGPKTAADLLRRYGSVESILRNLDRVTPSSLREKIERGRRELELSMQLVTLDGGVDLDFDVEDCRIADFDAPRLAELFRRLGFRRFLKEMPGLASSIEGRYEVFELPLQAVGIERLFKGRCLLSVVPAGRGVAMSVAEGEAWWMPLEDAFLEKVKALMGRKDLCLVGHDLKDLLKTTERLGVKVKCGLFDTAVAAYLLNPTYRQYSAADVVLDMLGGVLPEDDSPEPACARADALLRCMEPLRSRMEEHGLLELFGSCEMPLLRVLVSMELTGIAVDRVYLQTLSSRLQERLSLVEKEAWKLAGRRFNLASPRQVAAVLFDELGLRPPRGRRTTDASVLMRLAGEHPLPALVVEYRSLSRKKSAYVDALLEAVGEDGRVHTEFCQTATATGRLSSMHPNLQNIPVEGDEDFPSLRRAFVAPEGFLLLSADYSQMEFRILAHLSGDERLHAVFDEGRDVYVSVAAELFGVPVADVTPSQRKQAKVIALGVVYGMGAAAVGERLGISYEDAARFVERFFSVYDGVRRFVEEVVERAGRDMEVRTLLGRRRPVFFAASEEERLRSEARRIAVNSVIQGSAADVMKMGMVRLAEELDDDDARMVLQVHDEVLLEVREGAEEEIARLVEEVLSGCVDLSVPLDVDTKWGRNWAEAGR